MVAHLYQFKSNIWFMNTTIKYCFDNDNGNGTNKKDFLAQQIFPEKPLPIFELGEASQPQYRQSCIRHQKRLNLVSKQNGKSNESSISNESVLTLHYPRDLPPRLKS